MVGKEEVKGNTLEARQEGRGRGPGTVGELAGDGERSQCGPELGPRHRASVPQDKFTARPCHQGQQRLDVARGREGASWWGGGSAQGGLLLPPLCLALSPAQSNSGSSLVCQVNHTWVQMGVVSWMFSCNQHSFPTLYTSTAYFTHWIKRRVAEVRFVSRAPPAFPSPVFLTGYTLLVSLGSLWLL